MSLPGALAPAFRLDGFELGAVTEPVLLAFFKITCPTCQLLFPYLQRLADRGGPAIVGISQDDKEGTDEFIDAFGVRFSTVEDPAEQGYRVSNGYNLKNVPTLVLVEPGGRISWKSVGFVKHELETLASRWGVTLFDPGDLAPAFKPG